MLVVKRTALVLIMIVSIGVVGAIGVRGYRIVGDAQGYGPEASKLQSEIFVYLAIVFSIVLLLAYGVVLLRSRNLYRELDRLIELTRFGNISMDDTLKKIGKLGDKIRLVYSQLNELNRKRSLKISVLSRINEFLLGNIDLSCLVLDATGRITEASRRFLETRGVQKADVVGQSSGAVLEDISFGDIVQELEKERRMVELDTREPAGFLPIFNRLGELSQVICVLGKEKLYVRPVSDKPERVGGTGRMSGFLRNIGRQWERRKESNG